MLGHLSFLLIDITVPCIIIFNQSEHWEGNHLALLFLLVCFYSSISWNSTWKRPFAALRSLVLSIL
jgi:hypothetical protein